MQPMDRASSSMSFRPGVDAKLEGNKAHHVDTLSRLLEHGLTEGHAAAHLISPFWVRFVDARKALLISRALSHAYGPSEALVDLGLCCRSSIYVLYMKQSINTIYQSCIWESERWHVNRSSNSSSGVSPEPSPIATDRGKDHTSHGCMCYESSCHVDLSPHWRMGVIYVKESGCPQNVCRCKVQG